ncbi:MAG: spore coat protein U domain-containing protein [Alphaproteobacteria bacterium]|nr:spore coat protein U domain-containing protein [Alphaproteobacteria bacterium]
MPLRGKTSFLNWGLWLMVTQLLCLVAAGAHAAPSCGLKIADLSNTHFLGKSGLGYEVFDRTQYIEVINFTVEAARGTCPFVIGFSAGSSNAFDDRQLTAGGSMLHYQLFRDAAGTQILEDIPLASESGVLTGVASAGAPPQTLHAVFAIPSLQVVPPGNYTDRIVVSAYEGTLADPVLRDQEKLTLSASVQSTTEFCLGDAVNFDPTYRTTCVEIGELEAGKVETVRLRARSNAGYTITLTSQNGGALQNLAPGDSSRIPYVLDVDGRTASLAGKKPVDIANGYGLTSPLGDEHLLRFTIGDTRDASSGQYEDTIEVTMYSHH